MSLPAFEQFSVTARDGTRLACQRYGRGPLRVVVANGIGGTLLAWVPLLRALEDRCTFVSWDYRGLYGSDAPRDPARVRIVDNASDLAVVMEAAGFADAAVFGWSLGVQVAIQAAADLRERVTALVLVNGTFGRIFETAFQLIPGGGSERGGVRGQLSRVSGRVLPVLNRAVGRLGPFLNPVVGLAVKQPWITQALEQLRLVDKNLDREVFTAIARDLATLDFALYHRMLGEANEHDGEPLLGGIRVPILMITGERDLMTPHSVTEVVERRAPQTETLMVPRGTHYSLIEYPEVVVPRVSSFLERHLERPQREAAPAQEAAVVPGPSGVKRSRRRAAAG